MTPAASSASRPGVYPKRVRIVEVGPRDGLQNEKIHLEPATRIALIRKLALAGHRCIEVGSFVSAQRVPQMAHTDQVLAGLPVDDAIDYPVLVPNVRGLDDALAAGAKEVAVFIAASESFSNHNTNCSVRAGLQRAADIARRALQSKLRVRGYISCVVDCPYEGAVAPETVALLARGLRDIGCYEVSLGETLGTATAGRVDHLLDEVCGAIGVEAVAVHFHQSYGQALVNVHMALQKGIAVIDSSVGGLGGCPFAPGAAGNLATEDLVYLLDGLGIESGIDLSRQIDAAWFICDELKRGPSSQVCLAVGRR